MSQAEKTAEEARRNILVHVKQTLELLGTLHDDMHSFRLVDEGNGANDDSVRTIELALDSLRDISSRLKFIAVRSESAYGKMKDVYLAMQDAKAYVGQAVKKPSTSSKDIFITPFRTLAANLQRSTQAFVSAVNCVASTDFPNPSVHSVQYQLGLAHLHGLEGRPVNHAAAVDCFRQAAEVGNTEAMVCLAKSYIQGHGADKNEQKGLEWLVRAANSNVCPHAQNELALLIIANLKDSNPLCVKEYCASLIDDSSVARSLRRGQSASGAGVGRGDQYGVEDAIKLLLSAASEGCADAKSSLGAVYEEAGDIEQAATW
jgi:TPR repeat protein